MRSISAEERGQSGKYNECGKSGVDISIDKYPYCIVWSPLPPITWILPFIGHTGIAGSDGVIMDFAGPYSIGRGNFAFGAPTKYLQLNPERCSEADFDTAINEGCSIYSQRMHDICFDNCHSHVARCLNVMGYRKYKDYTMFHIGGLCFFFGRFTSIGGFIKTYLPFGIIITLVLWGSGTF